MPTEMVKDVGKSVRETLRRFELYFVVYCNHRGSEAGARGMLYLLSCII